MTFKFSDRERIIRIYNLRADTREFIGAGDAYIPPGMGLPADCTNIAPPNIPGGKAAVFGSTKWNLAEDHRNKLLYSKETGKQVYITDLGPLPPDVTAVAPEGDFMCWGSEGWVKDTEAERASAVAHAAGEKKRLIQEATLAIGILQDAFDLAESTDEEQVSLSVWKKYRVMVNRVDTSLAPACEWPEKPAR